MFYNYKEAADKAYLLHTQNKFDEAKELYLQLLEANPDDVNILNLYGLLCIATSDYDSAINSLTKAVVLNSSAYIVSNLAKAYMSKGDIKSAVKLLEETLTKSPNDDIYYSLAIAYKKLGNIEKSVANYKNALDFNPKNYNASYNLALIYKELNDYENAVKYSNICLDIIPDSEEICAFLSTVYEQTFEFEKAIKMLEKAVFLNPKEHLYYYNLGVLYSKIKNIEKSIYNYKKVIELSPNNVSALVNLCSVYRNKDINIALSYILRAKEIAPCEKNVLLNLARIYRDLYRNEESIYVLNRLLELNNKSDEAYSLLGVNYMDLGEYEKALLNYEKAARLNPINMNYQHGRASALKYLGNYGESKRILESLYAVNPKVIQTATSLGMIYLYEKNFEKGMELYSKRSLETNFVKIFTEKVWNKNTDLTNKTVLVYSDCGLGDTVMYVRYINELTQIAKNVILQTDKELISLLSHTFKNIKIVSKAEKVHDYDVVIPIMNLGWALNLDFSNIPYPSGYLTDDIELTKKYSTLDIFNTVKIKAGIFREGNKRIFKNRVLPVSELEKLTESDLFQFYSFQKDNNIPINNVVSLNKFINDYNDTASLLKNVDLLITIDSSIVHVAGALGIKTYLLLPYTAEWRWFNDDRECVWYNSVKIIRQKRIADWSSVIDDLMTELNKNAS